MISHSSYIIFFVSILLSSFCDFFSDNLNIDSTTDTSAPVVSNPQKAFQSLTTNPVPITSHPLFTVPAQRGIYNKLANSSNSSTVVNGWTIPPLLIITQ